MLYKRASLIFVTVRRYIYDNGFFFLARPIKCQDHTGDTINVLILRMTRKRSPLSRLSHHFRAKVTEKLPMKLIHHCAICK